MSFKSESVRGGLRTIRKRIKEKPGTVDIGIIDAGSHDESKKDLTVAAIGFIQEFGAVIKRSGSVIIIPERSFMRSTTKENRQKIKSMAQRLFRKVLNGKSTYDQALGLLGEFVSSEVRNKIVALKEPPNAPLTIAKKGSSNPLIASSQLKNSITYGVNRK